MNKRKGTIAPIGHSHLATGLRLMQNADGTFTDQYGRLLERYTNNKGKQDLRPIGVDPKGARH